MAEDLSALADPPVLVRCTAPTARRWGCPAGPAAAAVGGSIVLEPGQALWVPASWVDALRESGEPIEVMEGGGGMSGGPSSAILPPDIIPSAPES